MIRFRIMKYIYLSLGIAAYWKGFLSFCTSDPYCTGYAMVCALSLLLFFRCICRERYYFMKLKKIDKMSGRSFELYLKAQFERLRYRVTLTEASNDYGADLILKKRGKKIVVQAKRYDKNVGIAAVQEVIGAVAYYDADEAMVVTNQYFTKNAYNLAKQNNVTLWTRKELKEKMGARD